MTNFCFQYHILMNWWQQYILGLPGALPRPSPKKQKIEKIKKSPRKKFLLFQEMELSSSNIKTILIFPEINTALFDLNAQNIYLKKFLISFLKKPTLKNFLIFPEMEPRTFQSKLEK